MDKRKTVPPGPESPVPSPRRSSAVTAGQAESEGIRLQKILSQAGLASRRAAERLIVEGRVSVNGKTVRVRNVLHLLSPLNYRVASSISVDGGAFTNLGNPWWRKAP